MGLELQNIEYTKVITIIIYFTISVSIMYSYSQAPSFLSPEYCWIQSSKTAENIRELEYTKTSV